MLRADGMSGGERVVPLVYERIEGAMVEKAMRPVECGILDDDANEQPP